jgi:hypothetical protein
MYHVAHSKIGVARVPAIAQCTISKESDAFEVIKIDGSRPQIYYSIGRKIASQSLRQVETY